MISYRYQALDSTGDHREGLRVAQDQDALERFLEQQGLTPLRIEKHKSFRVRPIRHKKTLSRFFRNMQLFLESGMDLIPALRQVSSRLENDQMKACIETMLSDLESGRSLGDSMASCEPYFPLSAHRICAVGERTGHLDLACEQLSGFYRAQHEFLEETYDLLLYPLIVLAAGSVVVLFLLTYVLPRLRILFQNRQEELPLFTKVLLGVSDFTQGWGVFALIAGLGACAYGIWLFLRSQTGSRLLSRLLLYSTVYRKIKMQLFCLAMAMSTRVGLNISEALDLGTNVLQNPYMVRRMNQVAESVRAGQTLTDSLENNGFDLLPLDSLAAGEQTGNLPDVFSFNAELLSDEVRESLNRLVTLFEPAMILVMTMFVGLVLLAVMWPIVTMTTSF